MKKMLTDNEIIEILVITVLYTIDTEECEDDGEIEYALFSRYDLGVMIWKKLAPKTRTKLFNHAKKSLNQLIEEIENE